MNKEKIATFYTYLSSQQSIQQFLHQCYQDQGWENPETNSYKNSMPFLYYLEHGHMFYQTGNKISAEIKPILLFYGMTYLLKALLVARRPHYPESTKILAHGVSTRKRKKRDYTFLEDEVRIQQNGLFAYFSNHLYHIKKFPKEKYRMIDLLSVLPHMNHLFQLDGQKPLCKVGEVNDDEIIFPSNILDTYFLTAHAFVNRVKRYLPIITKTTITKQKIHIQLSKPIDHISAPFYVDDQQQLFFPRDREHFFPLSEVMIYYLLLYNLSMVSRYETEWWGDLISNKTEKDHSYINHFLQIANEKVPLLIGKKLYSLHKQST